MVGTNVKYPNNETTDYIHEVLKKDGIALNDFYQSNLAFKATGCYRKVIERPKAVKYDILNHDDYEQDLQCEYYNMIPHPETSGSKYKSLRLQFQLPQSTYATMLFRELTKSSSTVNYQANLSKTLKK
jgi:tRNA(Glu) U13 pseudouridine synthase TruD